MYNWLKFMYELNIHNLFLWKMQIFSEARLYNWLPCVDAYFV